MLKQILVLAKSYKTGGYCVGGLELVVESDGQRYITKNWIRPVTIAENGEHKGCLPHSICSEFNVFDVIELDLIPADPIFGQPENYLIQDLRIQKVDCLEVIDCLRHFEKHNLMPWHDTRTVRDDQISSEALAAESPYCSLMLIQPENLVFTLTLDLNFKRKLYASFTYQGKAYQRIPVTEPALLKLFKNQYPLATGSSYDLVLRNADAYWLTLSLTPEFLGHHYMLVAGVLDHCGYLNRSYG